MLLLVTISGYLWYNDILAGGNAGLAATYCAQHLKKPIQVIVPESTPASVVEKLKKIGADVLIFGKVRC